MKIMSKLKFFCNGYAKPYMTSPHVKLTFWLFLIGFFMVSCTKEEQRPPELQIISNPAYVSGDTSLAPGGNFFIGIRAEAGSEPLTQLLIFSDDGFSRIVHLDTGMHNSFYEGTRKLNKGVAEEEIFTVLIRDASGKEANISFRITRKPGTGFSTINQYVSLMLGAQKNPSNGSFCNLWTGNVLSLSGAFQKQDSIDMIYYYDFSGDANTIVSPNANIDTSFFGGAQGLYYWTVKNETRYLKTSLSESDYNSVQNDSLLLVLYNDQLAKRKAKNLVAGDIYSFRTASLKYGLFRVIQVNGAEFGDIVIDMKIQK